MPRLTSLALIAPLCLAGCARIPRSETGTAASKLLRVTFRVRTEIQPAGASVPYYYFVLINRTDQISDPGPVPVTDRPWGNGFAAASQIGGQGFVGFVRFDRFQPTGYRVYTCTDPVSGALRDPTLFGANGFTDIGPPDSYQAPQPGESTLTFQLDLSRLPRPTTRFVQINLLATNNLPQGADDAPKTWDALGEGAATGSINTFLTLDTTQNILRRNTDTIPPIEPPADDPTDVRDHLGPLVNDPSLDIVDWSVEIRNP